MRIFCVDGIIVNVDDNCPSVAKYVEMNHEELPIELFGDYPQFATTSNTVLRNNRWEYRYDPNPYLVATNYLKAKALREELIESPIEAIGSVWDVDAKSIGNMNDAVSTYLHLKSIEDAKPIEDRNPIPTNVNWVLHDNTARVCTYTDLRTVMYEFAMRKQYIFIEFITWVHGSKLKPFNPTMNY